MIRDALVDTLAKALWDVVPYDRFFSWEDHPNGEVHEHYRARARKLLKQFYVIPKETG